MENQVKERCKDFFLRFEGKDCEVTGEFLDLIGYASFKEKHMAEDPNLELIEFLDGAFAVAFTFGFAIGQAVETTDAHDRETLDMIQRVIRDKHLLPHFPREKANPGA